MASAGYKRQVTPGGTAAFLPSTMASLITWTKPRYIATIVFTWVSSLIVFAFVIIGATDESGITGVFNGTVDYLSEEPKTYIHIPKWSVAICIGFCYFDQFVFLLYATSAIFRKSPNGISLYLLAPSLHPFLFGTFFITLVLRLVNLFLISSSNFIGGLVCQYTSLVVLYMTLFLSIYGTHKYNECLVRNGFTKEGRNLVSLVHNSLATYPGWELIFSNARLAEALVSQSTLSNETASAVGLGLFAGQYIILLIIELGLCEYYLRFVCSAPLIYIFVLMSMTVENFNASRPISAGIVTMLVVSTLVLFIKIILGVLREKRKTTFHVELSDSNSQQTPYGSGGVTHLT